MRKNTLLLVIAIIYSLVISGCAMYGNEAQYKQGDWYGFARPETVAKIQEEKLALKKMEHEPQYTKPGEGYLGIIKNFSRNRIYNFVIIGPEKKTFLIGPEGEEEAYLIPGDYTATVYEGGSIVGKPWRFPVGPEINSFLGKDYHWYVYAQW